MLTSEKECLQMRSIKANSKQIPDLADWKTKSIFFYQWVSLPNIQWKTLPNKDYDLIRFGKSDKKTKRWERGNDEN